MQLTDDTVPVNFIVHRGDTKDPDNSPDRAFVPAATPEIWLRQGDATIYTSQADALGTRRSTTPATASAVTVDAFGPARPPAGACARLRRRLWHVPLAAPRTWRRR